MKRAIKEKEDKRTEGEKMRTRRKGTSAFSERALIAKSSYRENGVVWLGSENGSDVSVSYSARRQIASDVTKLEFALETSVPKTSISA